MPGYGMPGLAAVADEPLNLAQPPQRVDFTARIITVPGKGQGLGVVLAGLAVLADEPRYLAEPHQSVGFTALVTKVSVGVRASL